ncbi:MAG: NAD(+)/NADH kinase [Mariprofundales bacterium]|nr:NAD(+)/NADH kinase [Mariprofundales bacterium]
MPPSPPMRIGITCNPAHHRAKALGDDLLAWLHARQHNIWVDRDSYDALTLDPDQKSIQFTPLAQMPALVDLMIVLGGDGTLLNVGRHVLGTNTPILAINLGRLGFLTDTPAGSMLDVVEQALAGKLKARHHFGLRAECWRGDQRLLDAIAVNDVVVQRSHNPHMVTFAMSIRDQFVFRMRADGLVLATPAGSTAYALSAGGAIVHPEVEAISVVPICPHTLSNRPIVVPATDQITITVQDCPAALSLDGNPSIELQDDDTIQLSRSGSFTLLHQPERHYYEVLRNKLHWADQTENQC